MHTPLYLAGDRNDDVHYRWLVTVRLGATLAGLLVALPWLLTLGTIETLLTILSVMAGGTSQLLRCCAIGTGGLSTQACVDDEFLSTLEALGAAGVGTLIVLYLLA